MLWTEWNRELCFFTKIHSDALVVIYQQYSKRQGTTFVLRASVLSPIKRHVIEKMTIVEKTTIVKKTIMGEETIIVKKMTIV